ncbi:AAA family ATPase [Kiritimatiellaeota bacterium B1221]|nr:AAA family ATPase [Kiritimatiellaeota bacterium B1221]
MKHTIKQPVAIILNGPSRTGKSSLAEELQLRLNFPALILSMDAFYCHTMVPALVGIPKSKWPHFNWASALYASSSSLVREGHSIILDTLTVEPLVENNLLKHFENIQTYFIGLKCPLEMMKARIRIEQKDDEGALSNLETQFDTVHKNSGNFYDLELDTSVLSTQECGDKVLEMLDSTSEPVALSQLRQMTKETSNNASKRTANTRSA